VRWERYPCFRYARFFTISFFVLFFITFSTFLFGLFTEESFPKKVLSLSIIFLAFCFLSFLTEAFLNSKLKNPKIEFSIEEAIKEPARFNLAEFLTFEVAKAVYQSFKFAQSRLAPEINSTILFHFLLEENPELDFIFYRLLLDFKEIRKRLEDQIKHLKGQAFEEAYSKDFQKTILESLKIAKTKGNLKVEVGDILSALAKHNKIFKKILTDFDLKAEDIWNLTWWLENLKKKDEQQRRFWDYENLLKTGSIGKDWAAAYTVNLDRFSTDWSTVIERKGFRKMIGFGKELTAMERILSREEINNVLIIGRPGAGRMKLVQELGRRALFDLSFPQINSKRIVSLDIVSVISQSESREEIEMMLDKIFNEVIKAGNVILVIDDFHNYIGQEPRPGVVDISGTISSYLAEPEFRLIAVTNYTGFHKFIEPNSTVLNLFEKVEISELPERDVIRILENWLPVLEQKYKVLVSYPAVRDIVEYSAKYLPDIAFPKKAIGLLDEIMVYVANFTKSKLILPGHVARVISDKTEIPVGELEIKEREMLLNLEDLIHRRIIDQEEGAKEISSALRRARAEVTVRKGPIGTFLFLGPTGVGKTETSKALAEIYFGSESRTIRLDMSEFQSTKDIPRLIGSVMEEGLLSTPVRENPFSLVLLDEIEKAHPKILNLFLQVLDEGHLTDGLGRKVNFKNTIIIATSNAGAEIIWEDIKQDKKMDLIKDDLLDFLVKKGIFRPEFLNRFDAVVVFKPLTKENLLDIAELMLRELKKNLKEKGVEFIITMPLKEKIVELGYDPKFGARAMRRVIQDKVGNILAQALLANELKRGDKADIDPKGFKLIINP